MAFLLCATAAIGALRAQTARMGLPNGPYGTLKRAVRQGKTSRFANCWAPRGWHGAAGRHPDMPPRPGPTDRHATPTHGNRPHASGATVAGGRAKATALGRQGGADRLLPKPPQTPTAMACGQCETATAKPAFFNIMRRLCQHIGETALSIAIFLSLYKILRFNN